MANGSLDDVNTALSIFLFLVTLIIQVFVAVKVRFNLDLAMIVISLAFLLSFFFRTPVISKETDFNLVYAFASMVIWGSLYFFVFEMKRLKDTLTSESLEQAI